MAKAGFLARLAALTAVRPRPLIVHTYHGHVLEGYFGPTLSRLYRSLEAGLGRRQRPPVGVSEATVDDLVRLGVAGRDRFQVIPLGLDLEPFATLDPAPGRELRRGLGIGDDDVVLSFVGRVVRSSAWTCCSAPWPWPGRRPVAVARGRRRRDPGALQELCRELGIADRCASSAIGAT